MTMNQQEAVDFLFTISKEYKHFLESPVIMLTRVDYADQIFNALCEMRTSLLLHRSTVEAHDVIARFHRSWQTAILDVEAFKRRIKDTPRESIYQAVDFTVEAVEKRLNYFRQYMKSLESTMSEDELNYMSTDIEIIMDMHTAMEAVLLEKKIFLMNHTDSTEFNIKVADECDEILNWLDKINDSVALRFTELIGGSVPELSNRLKNTLRQVIQDMAGNETESMNVLLDKLRETELHLTSTLRTSDMHELEISKVMEKIATLTERINILSNNKSSAVMALQHKKMYLEERLQSLFDIHVHLRSLQDRNDGSSYPKGVIFNHKLPEAERELLVTGLIKEWDVAVKKTEQPKRKSIISILSVADLRREHYTDSNGCFFVDRYGRKLYTKDGDEELYQIDENNELVPLSDDKNHIYYYDDCGRYYLDDQQTRIYKRDKYASEYMLDTSGVMLKVREEIDGVTYYYDSYGRHYIDNKGKHIYRETDQASEYEDDGFGNLVRLEREPVYNEPCAHKYMMSAESEYLRQTVGDALKTCIAEVILRQPAEPIYYLAKRLLKYRADMEEAEKRESEQKEFMAEREVRIAEEREAAERAAALEAQRLRELMSSGGSEASFDSNMMVYESPDNII